MRHFVNEYELTDEISGEAVKAWWSFKFKFRQLNIWMVILLILVPILAIVTKTSALLFGELAVLILWILIKIKVNQAVKIEKERKRESYPNENPVIYIEIGDDIYLKTANRENHISFADAEKVVETKELIVIMIKGAMNISLSKEGFTEGNAEKCMDYLREKIYGERM